MSDGTGYWDHLTPIWSDGEHVGGPPERADGCPATIAAEGNILHLGREDIGSVSAFGQVCSAYSKWLLSLTIEVVSPLRSTCRCCTQVSEESEG